jgi:hypothetical protein
MDRTEEQIDEMRLAMAFAVIAEALDEHAPDPHDMVTLSQYVDACGMALAMAEIEPTDENVAAFRELVEARWLEVNDPRLDEPIAEGTNITYRHCQMAETVARGGPEIGLYSITVDGEPTSALALAEKVEDAVIYHVLFVAPTDKMVIVDHDGQVARPRVDIERERADDNEKETD